MFQTKRFLSGLACEGPYCDNVLPYTFKSSRLANAGSCDWTQWSSERPAEWIDCGADRLMCGLRCRSDWCGDISAYCCTTKVE